MNVFESIIIDRPANEIWAVLRDFIGLTAWSPVVTAARITNEMEPDTVGAVRHLDIADGSHFIEALESHSDDQMMLQYSIIEGPIPVTQYLSTMKLTPVTVGDQTFATWSAEFEVEEKHAESMRKVVGGGICRGGLKAMKAYFEGA
jgi:hypothetical protein